MQKPYVTQEYFDENVELDGMAVSRCHSSRRLLLPGVGC